MTHEEFEQRLQFVHMEAVARMEAMKRITELTTHNETCAASGDVYAMDDEHDAADDDFRYLLIESGGGYKLEREEERSRHADELRTLIVLLDRESLTAFALAHSLCPMHLIDYLACFEENDPECAAIRVIHPSHDT